MRAWDHRAECLVYLTDIAKELDPEKLDFLGPMIPRDVAEKCARESLIRLLVPRLLLAHVDVKCTRKLGEPQVAVAPQSTKGFGCLQ